MQSIKYKHQNNYQQQIIKPFNTFHQQSHLNIQPNA